MRRILKILTPENIYLEYELAGAGSRFIALFFDMLVQAGLLALAAIGMLLGGIDYNNVSGELGLSNSLVIALGIAVVFIIISGYFIIFEMVMNGQTPGKKAMRLKVMKSTGEPVGFFDSFLRNILRTADMLPLFYILGAVFVIFTRQYKRIGDLAANTVVVRVKKRERPASLEELIHKNDKTVDELALKNIYPVNNLEYAILKEFIARSGNLGARRPVFAYHLNRYFMSKFNIEKPYTDPYQFFKEIIAMNSGI